MVFCFVQKFFFRQHKSQNIIFFCRAKREIFFQNLTLGYMTKTLNQIIFFSLHQNQNIFFSNIGNQNIFLEKNHNPPFKINGRSLILFIWLSHLRSDCIVTPRYLALSACSSWCPCRVYGHFTGVLFRVMDSTLHLSEWKAILHICFHRHMLRL